jgi:hypothetical protein
MKHDYLELDIFDGAQSITDTFADVGSSVNIFEYDTLTLGFDILSNNSTDIQIKVLGKFLDTSTDWYVLPIKATAPTVIGLSSLIYEFSESDPKIAFAVDAQGLGFVKLQVKGTGNAPVPGVVTKIAGFATRK